MTRTVCEFCNGILSQEKPFNICYNHLPLDVYWRHDYLVICNQNYKFVKYYENESYIDESYIEIYNPKRFYLSFDYDIKITPENFETKIKKILVFL